MNQLSEKGSKSSLNAEFLKIVTLKNKNGHTIEISNFGAGLLRWICPDKYGKEADILLGRAQPIDYLQPHPFFGVTVGRFANRIGHAKFTISGREYKLIPNEGVHQLHGGVKGMHSQFWDLVSLSECGNSVRFKYKSHDGEEGFPGNVDVEVAYSLNDANELCIEYRATTDKDTPINLTNHAYFNLAGGGNIYDQILTLHTTSYLDTNDQMIPNGEKINVKDSCLDFCLPKKIGAVLSPMANNLHTLNGIDHYFIFDEIDSNKEAVTLLDPISGRKLNVYTDQPGLQVYTGNHLKGQMGKSGYYENHSGICFETHGYPDSPNHINFPSTILKADQVYTAKTIYKIELETT